MAEALYRKYRPQVFEDVVGQDNIERTLKNAIDQDKVSHAYLFCGPRGTGKTTTARLLAKALLCEHGPTSHPDGTCRECVDIANGVHPDVYELDAASRTGVDNVRDEIINRVNFAPTRGKVKVYIIDEVHMLSTAAFNALLKTLEEPPEHVIFILCTTDPQKVPETIHSRCQRFDFHRISNDQIVARLGAVCASEGVEFEGDALDLIAHRADGGMRNALTSLEQLIAFGNGKVTLEGAEDLLGSLDSSDMAEIITAVGKRDAAACFTWVAKYAETGADMAQFARDMAEHVRNLYVMSLAGTDAALDVTDAERREMSEELKYFGPDRLSRLLCVLGDLTNQLRSATNPRLCFEIALTRMVRPESDLTLESLAERVEALEARLNGMPEGGVAPVASSAAAGAQAQAIPSAQIAQANAAQVNRPQAARPRNVAPVTQSGSAAPQRGSASQPANNRAQAGRTQQSYVASARPAAPTPQSPQPGATAPRTSNRTSAGRAAALAALQNARARSHGAAPAQAANTGNMQAKVPNPAASASPVRPAVQPQQSQQMSQPDVRATAPSPQPAAPAPLQTAQAQSQPRPEAVHVQPAQSQPAAPHASQVTPNQTVPASQPNQPAPSPKRAPKPVPYEVPAPAPKTAVQPENVNSDVQNLVTNPAALQRTWHSVTVAVKREKVAFGVLLVNAHVRSNDQGAGVVIEFSDDNPFAFQMAQKPEVQQSIKAAFSKVAGFDVPFTMVQRGAQGQAPASTAPSQPHTQSTGSAPQPQQPDRQTPRAAAPQPSDQNAKPASSAAARAAMEAARARVHGLSGRPQPQQAPRTRTAQPQPAQDRSGFASSQVSSPLPASAQPQRPMNVQPSVPSQPQQPSPNRSGYAQPQASTATSPQNAGNNEPVVDDVPLSVYDDVPWETDDDPYAALAPEQPSQTARTAQPSQPGAPQPVQRAVQPQQPAQPIAQQPASAAAGSQLQPPSVVPTAYERQAQPVQPPVQKPAGNVSAVVAAAQARARAAMAGRSEPASAAPAQPAPQQNADGVPVDDSGNPLSADEEAAQLGKMLSDTMGANIVFKQVDE